MAANVENHSPEISGLPVSLRIRPASLWFIAAISLGALAMVGGATVAGDVPAIAAVAELPAAAEGVSPAPAGPATAERTPPIKNPSVLPIVLRGQPVVMGRRS